MLRDITREMRILWKNTLSKVSATTTASKLSKEERNIGTLAAFRKMIRNKDVTLIVEGRRSECQLCLG